MTDRPHRANAQAGTWLAHPFDIRDDDDRFHEECGIFGVLGEEPAAVTTQLGLHALQHRGQEAAGLITVTETGEFRQLRRKGLIHQEWPEGPELLRQMKGGKALGHTRYATAGRRGDAGARDIQPFRVEIAAGEFAIAHNGNFTNAEEIRGQLVRSGAIFQSSSDTECVVHLMAQSLRSGIIERLQDSLRRIEGAYSIVVLTENEMIGVRDPRGVRPLVLGSLGNAHIFASETAALDRVGATFVRDVEPGEMVVVTKQSVRSERPFPKEKTRFCVFEYVYFSRPDTVINGLSVYDVRRKIGEELWREEVARGALNADIVCPVPDSGIPAAIGYAVASDIAFGFGVYRNPYVGRTFIEPTKESRDERLRRKLSVNRAIIKGKTVVLVDDSIVRGATTKALQNLLHDAGAKDVHFRIASPPTIAPCFYGVDTADKHELMAVRMSHAEMQKEIGAASLHFVSLEGLYRACGVDFHPEAEKRSFCDACFSGAYPIAPRDAMAKGQL